MKKLLKSKKSYEYMIWNVIKITDNFIVMMRGLVNKLFLALCIIFAFANITGGKIVNIPLVAIEKEHRGHGYSEPMLNRTIKTLVDWTKLGERDFTEVNVTTETNNYKALKLYRKIGFREDYCYPQAYLMQKQGHAKKQ